MALIREQKRNLPISSALTEHSRMSPRDSRKARLVPGSRKVSGVIQEAPSPNTTLLYRVSVTIPFRRISASSSQPKAAPAARSPVRSSHLHE